MTKAGEKDEQTVPRGTWSTGGTPPWPSEQPYDAYGQGQGYSGGYGGPGGSYGYGASGQGLGAGTGAGQYGSTIGHYGSGGGGYLLSSRRHKASHKSKKHKEVAFHTNINSATQSVLSSLL